MSRSRFLLAGLTAVAMAVAIPVVTQAYVLGVAKWSSTVITIYANPTNLDTDPTSAEAALVAAMDAWGSQSNAGFRYQYGGRVSDTTTTNDHRNVVIFRNATNGSAIATTYAWYSGTSLTDTDTIFWDGFIPFFSGTSGCSAGAYIQDVATHEFGHSLGLGHSSVADSTMYPSYSTCSQELRSLSADDIAGVEALYPGTAPGPSNTAPSVSISSPGNNSSFTEGTNITFAGSASDNEDGSLTASTVWTSSLSGQIGSGGSFSRTLTVGTHVITASVTDSGGLTASRQVTVTVNAAAPPPPPPTGPTLTARGYKVKGVRKADLSWSNLNATAADGFRNSSKVYSGSNTGKFTDSIGGKGSGSFTYRVCDTTGATCTNNVTVTF